MGYASTFGINLVPLPGDASKTLIRLTMPYRHPHLRKDDDIPTSLMHYQQSLLTQLKFKRVVSEQIYRITKLPLPPHKRFKLQMNQDPVQSDQANQG